MTEFFASQAETLRMIDPSVSVEMAFFLQQYKEGAKKKLHAKLLKELPAHGREEHMPDILTAITKLKEDICYTFGNDDAKSELNIAIEWVRALSMGTAPGFKGVADDPMLKELQGRVAYLARCEKTEGETTSILYGTPALKHLMGSIGADMAKGEKVTLGDLQIFDSFSWLLTDVEKVALWSKPTL